MRDLIPREQIEKSILLLRGQKVMLDTDLANLYGVDAKQQKDRSGEIETGFRRILCLNCRKKNTTL